MRLMALYTGRSDLFFRELLFQFIRYRLCWLFYVPISYRDVS